MSMKMPGTYCPLCGNMGLFAVKVKGKMWVYCPIGATGVKDAHTAYEYKGSSVAVPFGEDAPVKEASEIIEVAVVEDDDSNDESNGD